MLRTDRVTPRVVGLADRFGSRSLGRVWGGFSVIALLFAAIAALYGTGGPPGPVVHLLYIPVLLAAVLFGTIGGMVAGLLAGAATGPWMASFGLPADGQTPGEWAIRLAVLAAVGGLVGGIQLLLRSRLAEEERLVTALTETHAKTLSTFASTIELRDPFTGGHSNRVARNARAVAVALDLDEAAVRWAYWSGLLHDLGKVAVPERILLKPGPLTAEEMQVMRRHSSIGAQLLEAVSADFVPIAQGVKAHHERWDGTGYPEGMSGPGIPNVGRILGIVDVFEALTCVRPYRGPSDPEEALTYVRSQTGAHFDPEIVEVFEALFIRGDILIAADPGPETLEDPVTYDVAGPPGAPVIVPDVIAPDPSYHLARR